VQYASNLNIILCLDTLVDKIIAYSANGELLTSPRPTLNKQKHTMSDTYIISMYYSENEKRIGACSNDYSISFWEERDHFTFEIVLFYKYSDLHD
jgi:hypothetical protein